MLAEDSSAPASYVTVAWNFDASSPDKDTVRRAAAVKEWRMTYLDSQQFARRRFPQ